jgi:hypothetical protein
MITRVSLLTTSTTGEKRKIIGAGTNMLLAAISAIKYCVLNVSLVVY